jgi:hypothetical protein
MMWFICIYTCMIHLFYYVLHLHIRYIKNPFHYEYLYVKVLLCASSTDTLIWNTFHYIYPYMKHVFRYVLHPEILVYKTSVSFVLHPQIPVYETCVLSCSSSTYTIHETSVSLCASSTDTHIWNMFNFFFIHGYPYMKHLCVLHPQIPLYETCFIMCSSTFETDPALNSFACLWLALQRHQDVKWTYASFDLFTEDVNLVKIRLLVLCWTVVKDD